MGTSRPELRCAESSVGRPRGARRRGGAPVQAEKCGLGGRGPTPPAQDPPGRGAQTPAAARGGNPDLPGKPHRPLRVARIPPPPSVPPPHPRRDCSRIWGARVISQQGRTRALSNKGIAPEPRECPQDWEPGRGRLARRRREAAGGSEFPGVRVPRARTLRPPPPLEARPLVPARVAGGGSPGAQPGQLGGSQAETCRRAGAVVEGTKAT
ncbi:WD repeat-containing protein 86 isoform X1 [Pteropus vampyrus]|uniref:WD repeat-containing protein 86 isoform X1 n=1 Tax=Pteropus vampyrus TaxID=132908 RepID=A0A6P6BR43_PTEVA|nr:WD repeat-containing protein 86 isoform X1 [Pteropus vampyrus]